MFKPIRLIFTALMLCGGASCGNDIAFEHPTHEDLAKAREAQGLAKRAPQAKAIVQSDSLIPSLTPEQNAQRASYIKENVDKGMLQIQDQFKKLPVVFTDADFTNLERLANEYFGIEWDLKNAPPDLPPATLEAMQEKKEEKQQALSKEAQNSIQQLVTSKLGQGQSQTGTYQYSRQNNPPQYAGPEISISDITPPEQDIDTLNQLRETSRQELQKKMDEAEITLLQSEIDDFLKLNEELHKANQQTQLAYQMRQQGKNISQNTFNELSIKQGSIMQKINLINAPLEDAIYIKREPEMRAKHIAAMKLQYERQNKFPSLYDLGLLYEKQKEMMDLQREHSKLAQKYYQPGQGSSPELQELAKKFSEKQQELVKQRAEIEARIR